MTIIDETALLSDGTAIHLKAASPSAARKLGALRSAIRAEAKHLNASPEEASQSWLSTRRELAHAYGHHRILFLLAWQDSAPIGELQMCASRYHRLRHDFRLALGVHPDHQGRGVGRALLTQGIDWAKSKPEAQRLSLSLHADNARAKRLYKDLGFMKEGVRSGAILPRLGCGDDEAVDEILMALYLRGQR